MSLARRLSATVSPPNMALTRRGESSKYSTWSPGACTSKLKVFSPWSPKGPVPIVSVIACSSPGLPCTYVTPADPESPPASSAPRAYTDPVPPGQSMRLYRVCPTENSGRPGAGACAAPATARYINASGKGRDASGGWHGRGQRRKDLLRGRGGGRAARPGARRDRGQQDVGWPDRRLRRRLQGDPLRYARFRTDGDGC